MSEELTKAVLESQVRSLELEVGRLEALLARPVNVAIQQAPNPLPAPAYQPPTAHEMSTLTALQSINGCLGSIAMAVREIADSMKKGTP
jgi:hypothetical protein